jgi:hypothetical protein
MALESTQPLTEMSTRKLPGGKEGQAHEAADNFTTIREPIAWKMWQPRRLTTLRASTACYRASFTFLLRFGVQIGSNLLDLLLNGTGETLAGGRSGGA